MNIIRLINGMLILIGLLFFNPLAYFVGIMMIFAGLTGVCLMERLINKLGLQGSCDLKVKSKEETR
jgi:hypothetical protein